MSIRLVLALPPAIPCKAESIALFWFCDCERISEGKPVTLTSALLYQLSYTSLLFFKRFSNLSFSSFHCAGF